MAIPVTVAITTYQSALFIIETLESIYHQTYEDILLVISDDASTDDTLALVYKWIALETNRKRFLGIEVITVPENTGVAANCNRMIAAAKSEWIKSIAGDDILLPNCLADNMAFVSNNPDVSIVFSQVKTFQDTFEAKNYVRTTPLNFPDNLMHPDRSAKDQYALLLVTDRIHYTPSYFFNKQAVLKVGGYDESGRFIEDYPMWLKLTQSGERLHYFHKPTVGYRIHSQASNNVGTGVLFTPAVIKNFEMRKKMAHPFLPWEFAKSEHFVYLLSVFFKNIGWNKNKALYAGLYKLGSFYLNPFHYIYAIKKRMQSNRNNPFYL